MYLINLIFYFKCHEYTNKLIRALWQKKSKWLNYPPVLECSQKNNESQQDRLSMIVYH
jgi:hypothetical protein